MKTKIKNILKRNSFIRFVYGNIIYKPYIKNVYKDNYTKHCLLSYSVYPFLQKNKQLIHPNFVENYTLAETMKELGYVIDVYNNTYNGKIDFSKYDVILGEGIPISNFYKQKFKNKLNAKVIYYATGSHPLVNNFNSLRSALNFSRKSFICTTNSCRIVDSKWFWGATLADKYIILGNEVTKKTFDLFNHESEKQLVNPPFYATNVISNFMRKNRKSFLWFGSFGLVHKDLNTVIDVFLANPEYELHICGRFDEEKEFKEYYNDIIKNSKNIFEHGYISVASDEFKELMETCSYILLSSVAEGCATGVITAMGNGGLIPIVTKECGLTIDNGFYVNYYDFDSIQNAVFETNNISNEKIIEYTKNNIEKTNELFSINKFKQNIKQILNNYMEE